MFLSDSHSDGTHSHPLLRHISTNLMKTQAHGLRVSACSDHCHYWVIHSWSCTWEDEHRTEAAVVLRARSLWFPRTRYHTAHYTHPWSRPRPPPEPSCTQKTRSEPDPPALYLHACIWSVIPVCGNRTHDFGVARDMFELQEVGQNKLNNCLHTKSLLKDLSKHI